MFSLLVLVASVSQPDMRELFRQWQQADNPAIVTYANEQWQWIVDTPAHSSAYLKVFDVAQPYRPVASYWVMVNHARDRTTVYRTTLSYMQFNCDMRSINEIQVENLLPNGRASSARALGSRYAVPGSTNEALLNKVCQRD